MVNAMVIIVSGDIALTFGDLTMNPILAVLLGRLSERMLVVLLLQVLEQVKPFVVGTSTQLDDVALDALIVALRRAQEEAADERPGNSGAF